MRLLGNVNLRHATSYYTDLPLTEAFRNGNTDFLGASVELALRNGLGIQLWGRNLTKENTYLGGHRHAGRQRKPRRVRQRAPDLWRDVAVPALIDARGRDSRVVAAPPLGDTRRRLKLIRE